MNNQFNFKYSAPTEEERKEINSIRRQYSPQAQTETKLQRLRRLDAKVKNTATSVSLAFGVVGCLIFGLGLTMFLEWNARLFGVLIGAIGIIPVALAYPAYKHLLNKGKQKYGREILALSEELLNETSQTSEENNG